MAEGPMSTPRRPAPRSIGTPTMPISRGSLAAWGLFACVIVVEPATGLAAKVARRDHVPQQRRRSEARLLEFVEQDVGDEEGGVQTDVVEQCEWTHRVAGAEHHPDVDVFLRGEALLEHAHRFGEVRDEQEVDDEAAAVLADDDALTQAFAKLPGGGQGFV